MAYLFNPQGSQSSSRWHWLSLIGPDALDFLHRITTVNTHALAVGDGSSGFILTPQAKIRAWFHLWNYREGEYAFELGGGRDDQWKASLLTALDQYTFAEKITLADVTALECRWVFFDAGSALPEIFQGIEARKTLALEDEIRLCHHGLTDYGKNWISIWGRGARLEQWLDRAFSAGQLKEATEEMLNSWRIDAVRPALDSEVTDATLPLEVGLKEGVADQKGCYPGQEVIEKIVSLGSPAKRLVKIEAKRTPGDRKPAPGEKLLNDAEPPIEVGEVTSATVSDDRIAMLALVRKIHAKEGLPVQTAGGVRASVTQIAPYT